MRLAFGSAVINIVSSLRTFMSHISHKQQKFPFFLLFLYETFRSGECDTNKGRGKIDIVTG